MTPDLAALQERVGQSSIANFSRALTKSIGQTQGTLEQQDGKLERMAARLEEHSQRLEELSSQAASNR